MAFSGLNSFVELLEKNDELIRIKSFVDPNLEITEITDRISKQSGGGKAILFENTGTNFPVLINALGSEKRIALAFGRETVYKVEKEIEALFVDLMQPKDNLWDKLRLLPKLKDVSQWMPKKVNRKGICQEIVMSGPDLSKLPVLTCWPADGGPFVTLPGVHTIDPETRAPHVGMYRMQVFEKDLTGMHWHRHKTGANHFEKYKKADMRMPVSIALGGDPVYTYAATAPMPENVDEYLLAGFLRKKSVKLVKCLTNNLYVPEDADLIVEGYVDPSEDLIWEGPFGDHTGFYSLADRYPAFHVTCISHRQGAVYPSTIVGIPPMEDAWIGKATEKLFLAPIKLTLQPEIVDMHMPEAGVAHNLVLVKINKTYPGQGLKVINSLFGAGQMMFSKFIVVLSTNVDIRNYDAVIRQIFENTDIRNDLIITRGPLDVLDHSSDNFSFGGKMGIDASMKMPEETGTRGDWGFQTEALLPVFKPLKNKLHLRMPSPDLPLVIAGISKNTVQFRELLGLNYRIKGLILIVVDSTIDIEDDHILLWQVLSNTDPSRDLTIIDGNVIINSTSKSHPSDNFSRKWPNIVLSDDETIARVDDIFKSIKQAGHIDSPSARLKKMDCGTGAFVSSEGARQ